jgi:hypothetical protein
MLEKLASHFRLAVTVGIAQQRDAVAGLAFVPARCDHLLDPAHDQILRPFHRIGPWGFRFHHQNVAVGQHIDRARMRETRCQRFDLQSLGHGWPLAFLPSGNRCEMHWREEILARCRQDRVRTDLILGIDGLVVAGNERQHERESQHGSEPFARQPRPRHSATPTR